LAGNDPVLRAKELRSGYGAVPVINGVDLDVHAKEVVALFGRNGVGKTTLLKALIGMLDAWSGSIELAGEDCTRWPTFRRARAGVAYVPQGRGIFPKHTVRQNLTIGLRAQGRPDATIPEEVYEYFPILKERENQLGGTLSGGQQQMLAIARGLCGRPRIMLLDEPTEGIQPSIVQQLQGIVRRIVDETDTGVLLVEQNFEFGISLADRCMIMEKGEIIRSGRAEEFSDESVIDEILAM
jgi:urea ABC transporter ATP-binding protein UrtE